jgi:hypothetical protein
MNSTSGQGQIIIQNNGVNSTIIRDDATGSTDIIALTSALRLGANGTERLQLSTDGSVWLGGNVVGGQPYVEINGTTGQLLINGGTAGQLTFPTADGAAGQVLTTDGAGNLYFGSNLGAEALPLAGGTMSGNITFNTGQTFPGTVSASLLDVTGDIVYASATNTPASLPIGAAGTILGVNSGLPAWRTAAQLGVLTTALAASTYAPIDSPVLTGPVTVSSGGSAGSNALTVSGGNLVLSTSFTPASSSSPGSVGEIAWGAGYLYFCYAANTWGRVQIDLTPF